VQIRPWRSLRESYVWSEASDRSFPMCEVRANAPQTDDNQATLSVQVRITMMTKADDDQDRSFIAAMEDAGTELIHNLFAGFRNGDTTTGNPWPYFLTAASGHIGDETRFRVGGMTLGESDEPAVIDGIQTVDLVLVIHYARDDF